MSNGYVCIKTRGVWGHAHPEKFLVAFESILGQKQSRSIATQLVVPIFGCPYMCLRNYYNWQNR